MKELRDLLLKIEFRKGLAAGMNQAYSDLENLVKQKLVELERTPAPPPETIKEDKKTKTKSKSK